MKKDQVQPEQIDHQEVEKEFGPLPHASAADQTRRYRMAQIYFLMRLIENDPEGASVAERIARRRLADTIAELRRLRQ
jgi:hypothetical protein